MSEPTQVSFDDLHQFSLPSTGTPGLDHSHSEGRTWLSLLALLVPTLCRLLTGPVRTGDSGGLEIRMRSGLLCVL